MSIASEQSPAMASPVPTSNAPHFRRTLALLTLILVLGAVLRWHGITQRGFFFDEIWNVELANGHGSEFFDIPLDQLVEQPNLLSPANARPIWQVPGETKGVIHPPGLFVALRVWRSVFGDSMLALRSFSATWSMLAIALTFVAARHCFGTRPALWAALLSAVSLANIDQAQDLRGYTMLQTVTLVTVLLLLRLRGKESDVFGAIAVGGGTVAMMFTHYFAAGACAAIVFGAIVLLRGRMRWQTLTAIVAGGIIWVVLWLPHLRAQLAFVPETADIFLLDRGQSPLWSTGLRLLAAPYRALVADVTSVHAVTLIGGAIVIALLILRAARATADDRPLVWLGLAIVVGVLGSLTAIDLARQSQHLEFMKYFVLINPALCVLLASIDWQRSWLVPAGTTIALAILYAITPTPPKPDLRPQIAYLREHASPRDIILLPSFNPLGRDGQVTYLVLAHDLPWPTHRIVVPVGKASPELVALLPRDVRWFYFAFDARFTPERFLPDAKVVATGPAGAAAVYEVQAP